MVLLGEEAQVEAHFWRLEMMLREMGARLAPNVP